MARGQGAEPQKHERPQKHAKVLAGLVHGHDDVRAAQDVLSAIEERHEPFLGQNQLRDFDVENRLVQHGLPYYFFPLGQFKIEGNPDKLILLRSLDKLILTGFS